MTHVYVRLLGFHIKGREKETLQEEMEFFCACYKLKVTVN